MTVEKQVFPPPEPEPAGPSFRQYLFGWGAVFLGLVLLAVLLGVLMHVLR